MNSAHIEGDIENIKRVAGLSGVDIGRAFMPAGANRCRVAAFVETSAIEHIEALDCAVTVIGTDDEHQKKAHEVKQLYPDPNEIRDRLKALYDRLQSKPVFSNFKTKSEYAVLSSGQGKPSPYLKLTNDTTFPRTLLILGGMHGREWVPPRAILTCFEKLLDAYEHQTKLTYGAKGKLVYEGTEIRNILDCVTVIVAPMINPDGYESSRTGSPLFRKNASGVDIDRNFDVAWHYHETYYGSGTPETERRVSDKSSHECYRGPSAESEPETKNVLKLLAKNVTHLLDCHTWERDILHPWAIEQHQTSNATQSMNTNYSDPNQNPRGVSGKQYREYIDKTQLENAVAIGKAMQIAIRKLGLLGEQYGAPMAASRIYYATGTAVDYAWAKKGIIGLTLECARFEEGKFHGDDHDFAISEGEVHAAIIEYLKVLAKP